MARANSATERGGCGKESFKDRIKSNRTTEICLFWGEMGDAGLPIRAWGSKDNDLFSWPTLSSLLKLKDAKTRHTHTLLSSSSSSSTGFEFTGTLLCSRKLRSKDPVYTNLLILIVLVYEINTREIWDKIVSGSAFSTWPCDIVWLTAVTSAFPPLFVIVRTYI